MIVGCPGWILLVYYQVMRFWKMNHKQLAVVIGFFAWIIVADIWAMMPYQLSRANISQAWIRTLLWVMALIPYVLGIVALVVLAYRSYWISRHANDHSAE